MTYNIPFADLTQSHYGPPRLTTPPATDILAAVRRGQSYGELAAIYGVSESTLRRRVQDSGLVRPRRHGSLPPLVEDNEPEWMADGLCAQTDPEIFFPEVGGSPKDAKKVCAACPVREQCLAWVLERDERFGVWAGTTYADRKKLRKAANS